MKERLVYWLTGRVSPNLDIGRSAPRACVLFFLAAVLAVVFHSEVLAADGDLDTTFGTAGRVLTDVSGVDDYGRAVLVQADGKIVVVGHSGDYPGPFQSTIVRYNADGNLDATFGAGGQIRVALSGTGDALNSIVQQPDGKLVVGGFVYDYPWTLGLIVARFNPDGSLDLTFNGSGRAVFDYGDSGSETNAVLLQPDGKIVLVGMSGAGYLTDFVAARFNANGTFDRSFGSGGKLRTHFEGGYGTGTRAFAAALQPDGKIVAAGEYHTDNGNSQFALARYNTDGSLDQTFGTGGKVIGPAMQGYAFALAAALEPGGNIVIAGYQHTGNENSDFALMRFTPSGSVDTTFGNGGVVITDFASGSDDIAHSLALQRNGKLLVAGRTGEYPNFRFGVIRYNTDGSLDPGFGSGGKVVTVFNNVSQGFSVALQADGKAVVAGYSVAGTTGADFNTNFALARYNIKPSPRPRR
jgi:uncharacterized delta-60 repeat protein